MVAGEPTKKSYEAPAGDNTSERCELCVYPSWAVSIRVCIRPGLCLSVCVSVRDADRARRMSEAAVKRSDLENYDPDTPLEKLLWAREEMQRNF